MRLRYLTLNGYKTFASKMKFEFGDGITCIIGPNGSGKSNVADGLRWALGEQQFSLLRGKKTEDMIFSGSAKRSRASLAEVLLTFDNSDGFFPIEFSEIEIGRRAYRDGANEYVLNGNRVRLRDVSDILGHSGLAERTYTVIGQGLVDNALAQKPEERRALFEEAAGIGAYRDRREDTLRKLEETRHNLERARDILSEITPRLSQLERQASRARQHRGLADELDQHTRTWLGYHYRALQRTIETSTAARDAAQHAVAEALEAVNARDEEGVSLRAERLTLQNRLGEAQPKRDTARQANEAAAREVAVIRERVAALEKQVADAQRELDDHTVSIEAFAARATEAATAFAAARAAHDARQREWESAQLSASERQGERAALEQGCSEAQGRLLAISAELLNAQNQAATLRARQDALRVQLDSMAKRAADLGNQREAELETFNQLTASIDHDAPQTNLFDAQYESAMQAVEAARNALTQAQSGLAAAEAEERLTSRLSLFADMRAPLRVSADELAASASAANLPGVCGVLSSFIHVNHDDQKAVDAGLGDLLNAVVVAPNAPEHSEAGLTPLRAWLTEQPSGRVAIVMTYALRPLDDERQNNDRVLIEHARANQARPLLDAISVPDWLKPALHVIAGRKFIAHDLDAARELVAQLPDGCSCVTRDGEVAHAVGTLSLPAGTRPVIPVRVPGTGNGIGDSPIILGVEQPDVFEELDHETAKANLEHAHSQRNSAQREFDAARKALDEAAQAREIYTRENVAKRSRVEDTERKVGRIEEALAELAGDMERIEQEIGALDRKIAQADAELGRRQTMQSTTQGELNELEVNLRNQLSGGWLESLNTAQTALATTLGAMQNAELLQRERVIAHENALAQRSARAQRLAELGAQFQAGRASWQQLMDAATQAEAAWREADAVIAPLQRDLAAIEHKLNELDERKREAERTLRECESRSNAAVLELARHNDELENLRQRAMDLTQIENEEPPEIEKTKDDGPFDPSTGSGLRAGWTTDNAEANQVPRDQSTIHNPQSKILEELPVVEELPAGTEARIAQLRGQIKRLGAINYEAQAEFEELSKRHQFMTEQCDDLEKASTSLQQVIAELNDVMKATFRQTFDAVAIAFQSTFKALFGGGQAKLTLINPENIDECGVEIQAQPPGKRPQSLALLSGGERSLTATALLFALLQVKPTPFCVLDEVDAALDESNVGRFRSMLESLSEDTQFIIITHNRGTVEAATTIYGITMGADGASTALSLRLEEVK